MLLDRDLAYFLAIAAHHSLARAAASLGVTQPTLSRSIQKLEKQLGATLLERTAAGVALTAAGRRLVQRAQVAQVALDDAGREIRAIAEGASGHARVAVGHTVWPLVAHALVPRLHEERPVATLELNVLLVDQIVEVLSAGHYDFAVCVLPKELPPELEGLALLDDDLVPVARTGHPLAGRRLAVAQLLEYPWIGVQARLGTQAAIVAAFNAAGLPAPEYVVRTDTMELALHTVARTDFLALAPRWRASDRQLSGTRIALLEVPGMAYARSIGILRRRHGALGAIAARVLQLVEEELVAAR